MSKIGHEATESDIWLPIKCLCCNGRNSSNKAIYQNIDSDFTCDIICKVLVGDLSNELIASDDVLNLLYSQNMLTSDERDLILITNYFNAKIISELKVLKESFENAIEQINNKIYHATSAVTFQSPIQKAELDDTYSHIIEKISSLSELLNTINECLIKVKSEPFKQQIIELINKESNIKTGLCRICFPTIKSCTKNKLIRANETKFIKYIDEKQSKIRNEIRSKTMITSSSSFPSNEKSKPRAIVIKATIMEGHNVGYVYKNTKPFMRKQGDTTNMELMNENENITIAEDVEELEENVTNNDSKYYTRYIVSILK